jgi:hypothetical protein
MTGRPLVVLACGVLEDLLGKRLPRDMPTTWMDVALHNSPKKLAVALQERLDALPEPSTVLLGYGLCGNGLVGVKSGPHTLIVPRTHDCVAIFLGSHQRYVQRFFASPNTYYLTKGGSTPGQAVRLSRPHPGLRRGDRRLPRRDDTHYRKLCVVGFSQEELDACRPRVMEVAIPRERFGVV